MSWIKRVMATIRPLSNDQKNIQKALNEWFYTGDTYDLEKPDVNCELCGHPGIRYQFTIQNSNNGNELLIGSECITRFDISAIGKDGEILNQTDTAKKVRRDRNKLITESKKKRLINTLVALTAKDEDFNIRSFIEYYDNRGAFTPNQLKTLIWRLEEHSIPFKHSDFRMAIRRNREKDQLLALEEWQIEQLWHCMSSSQKKYYINEVGYDPTSENKRLEELTKIALAHRL